VNSARIIENDFPVNRGCEPPTVNGMPSSVAVIGGTALLAVVWTVATLAIDRRIRLRRRRSLLERFSPYRPRSVADQAQRWLKEQQN
jgi:hypothetical protein